LTVAVIDDGLADGHAPTGTENSSAGLKASAMIRAYDLGLGGGADQHKQTPNNNRSFHIALSNYRLMLRREHLSPT
jgi:hypothetical protein